MTETVKNIDAEKVFNVADWIVDEKELKLEKTVKISDKLPAFVIRSLTADETTVLEKASVKKVRNKSGQIVENRDQNRFIDKMIELSVVQPPLTNAALQEHYGTQSAGFSAPAATLRKMLTAGQYSELMVEINTVSGFAEDINEDIEEAKN